MIVTSYLFTSALLGNEPQYVLEPQKLSASIIYTKVAHSLERRVSVKFSLIKGGRVVSNTSMNIGNSIGGARLIMVGDYLNNGRSQIFISTEMGMIASYLLDFDGKSIRKLYEKSTGRVLTFPGLDYDGHFVIQEFWPKQQFFEHFRQKGEPDPNGYVHREVPVSWTAKM